MKEFTILSKYDENIILIKDKDLYYIDIDINSDSEKAFSRIHIEKSQLKKVKDFLNKLEDLEYESNSLIFYTKIVNRLSEIYKDSVEFYLAHTVQKATIFGNIITSEEDCISDIECFIQHYLQEAPEGSVLSPYDFVYKNR